MVGMQDVDAGMALVLQPALAAASVVVGTPPVLSAVLWLRACTHILLHPHHLGKSKIPVVW